MEPMLRWCLTPHPRSLNTPLEVCLIVSGFLYFLPNATAFCPADLVRFGLQHIVDSDDTIERRQIVRGWHGLPGILIGNRRNWPDGVAWSDGLHCRTFPSSHAENQAVCCWYDIPKPSGLERSKQLAGKWLTLADGNKWLCPHARMCVDGKLQVTLPRTIDIDDDGHYVYGDVLPAYRKIWEHANAYWLGMSAAAENSQGGDVRFQIDNPMQVIVDSLAANYRVSARELGVIGAIDDQLVAEIANVLVDMDGLLALQKKTDSDIGNG